MNSATLIEKLLAIEKAVGHVPPSVLRAMLVDLEDTVLLIDRDLIATLREVERLRPADAQPAHPAGPVRLPAAAEAHRATKKPPQPSADEAELPFVRRMQLVFSR